MTVTDNDFEKMYAELHSRRSATAQAYYLRNQAREANAMSDNSSSYLLMYVEEIYRRSLWKGKWDHDLQYKTLKKWARGQVDPIYVNGNTETTLAIVVRIVENIFTYANKHNLQDNNGNPITPSYLIKNVGIGRLKIVSNHFTDDAQTDFRDEIIIALTSDLTDAELKERYTKPQIPRIRYAENSDPNTGTDIIMFGLDEKQVKAFRNALQKLIIRYDFPLAPTDREVILKLLPSNARQQKSSELDSYDGDNIDE